MADLNLSADVTDLVRARREIRQWSKQTSDAIDIVNSRMKVLGDTSPVALTKFGGAAQTASRGMNRMGMVTQQAGYQVGDFLVQVQSGTNAFVAFGQQATQLVGLMGMFNPALIGVGAALGIAIPLVTAFGAAWLRTRQEQDDSAESAKTLASEIESVDKALQNYLNTARAAASGVSLEEIFTVDEIARAEQHLENVTAQLERIQNVDAADPAAGLAAIAEPFMALFDQDYEAQVDAAAQAVIDAQERLARLRRMQDAERSAAFVDRQQELQNEIALQEAILQYGDDSIEVERLRSQQALEGKIAEIREQQRLGELTEAQAINLERSERAAAGLRDRISEAAFQAQNMTFGDFLTLPEWMSAEDLLPPLSDENTTRAVRNTRKIIRANDEVSDSIQRVNDISEMMGNSFGDAFTSVIDGTQSVGDAFKSMARSIIAELYQIFVVKQITGFITGALQNAFTGGLAPATSPVPTPRPSTFASGGYMTAGRPALVGENGPELIIPNRQSTVMNADLTSKALGGGESVNVTQVFNINGNGDEYIMGKIAQAAPRIADATKKSILDERRRGGVYKSVFG